MTGIACSLRAATVLAALALGSAAQSQSGGIDVVAPPLPPRQGAGVAGTPTPAPAPAGAPAPSAPAPATSGTQRPRVTNSTAGLSSAAPSPLASGRPGASFGHPQPYETPADTQAAIATRSNAAGGCRAELSPDRQSISLMGADALPRQHVPLGEFRAQQVLHSPDGRWALAFTKLRGRPQFALLSLDLSRCEAAHSTELPAAADDARFDGDEAIVRMGAREQRLRLRSDRVR